MELSIGNKLERLDELCEYSGISYERHGDYVDITVKSKSGVDYSNKTKGVHEERDKATVTDVKISEMTVSDVGDPKIKAPGVYIRYRHQKWEPASVWVK